MLTHWSTCVVLPSNHLTVRMKWSTSKTTGHTKRCVITVVHWCLTLFSGGSKGDRHWRQPADITRNNINKKNCTSCLGHTHTHTKVDGSSVPYRSKFFQCVYEVGLHHSFTQTSDVDHRAGRDVMGVFSIVLKHTRVQQLQSENVFTSCDFSETWTEMILHLARLKTSTTFTSVKAAALKMDQEVKMSWFLNCFNVVTLFLASCFPVRHTILPFNPAFSWIKGKLTISRSVVAWTMTGWVFKMRPF